MLFPSPDNRIRGRNSSYLYGIPFQCQSDQSVCLIRHEQRDIQYVVVQFQVVQRESDSEFDLIREQFLDFFRLLPAVLVSDLTSTGKISFSRCIRKSTSYGGLLAELRGNPYVASIISGRISFTPEFKRVSYDQLMNGKSMRRANPHRRMAREMQTGTIAANVVNREFGRAPRKVLLTDITYLLPLRLPVWRAACEGDRKRN